MIIVLADIRSAHNVGSIFRTADAAGCTKLYLCGITPAPVDKFGRNNAEISKVALGAEEWLSWEHVPSCPRLLVRLKKEGYTILALEQSDDSISYARVRVPKKQWHKTVLVLGSEVKGLPRTVLNRADTIIEIPMHGKKESLNVAVAFGIVAFSLRGAKNFGPRNSPCLSIPSSGPDIFLLKNSLDSSRRTPYAPAEERSSKVA